jgi:hypothetical protein
MTTKGPGGHYSATNPIPNIQRFVESLDKDKKERDAKLEEQMRAKQPNNSSEAKDHKPGQPKGTAGSRKIVTDPTTQREIEIDDVNVDFMKAVDDPQVSTTCYSLKNQAHFHIALRTKRQC